LLFGRLNLKAKLKKCFSHLKVSPIFGHHLIVMLLILHFTILALRLISGTDENTMESNSASHFKDIEGDKKIGLTEAVRILQRD
jgi:hypothetical protein